MSDATFRVAGPADYLRVETAYVAWGYRGDVAPEDILYVAERDGELLGAVRRTKEHGSVLLRGMYIAPAEQRRGLGTQLLRSFVADLRGRACYCVPHAHLEAFYARAGFAPVAGSDAPGFLRERAETYHARGLDVLVMRHPGVGGLPDHAA
jgi:predicted N-acetyltransferase YhbS